MPWSSLTSALTKPEWASVIANGAVAAITALALIITTIVSGYQLSYTREQIELTRKTVQNELVYSMQKDARQIGLDYSSGNAQPSTLFAVMQSFYLQRRFLDTIPDRIWSVFEKDFCVVMARESLRRAWVVENRARYDADFVAYMEGLGQRCAGMV